MCKQLNGPVLKSLKPSCLSRNQKKLVGPGQAWANYSIYLYFVSGRDGPKAEISVSLSGRARADPLI